MHVTMLGLCVLSREMGMTRTSPGPWENLPSLGMQCFVCRRALRRECAYRYCFINKERIWTARSNCRFPEIGKHFLLNICLQIRKQLRGNHVRPVSCRRGSGLMQVAQQAEQEGSEPSQPLTSV